MLSDKIRQDLTSAMKAKEETKVATLRLLLSDINNRKIEKQALQSGGQAELTDNDVVALIRRGIKQRQESIEAYQKGNRDDLVSKEKAELGILNTYLPQQMVEDELAKIVSQTIKETGARGPQDFGKVMGAVMGKIKGKADGSTVSELVKKALV